MSGTAEPGAIRRWRAPGRVNVIGEHTDYNDGFALPMAIAEGCTAAVTVRADARLVVTSAQESATTDVALADLDPGAVGDGAAYVAGVVWALAGRGFALPGLTVHVDGNVPLGSGLSSSAALSCSVASAVNDVLGLALHRADLVAVARTAENDFVGAPTGGMDQLASIWGEAGHVLLCDMASLQTQPVPMDLAGAGLALLVTDSKAPHRHSDGEYRARREACERAAELLGVPTLRDVQARDHAVVISELAGAAGPDDADESELVRRARHVLTENDRVLAVVDHLERGDVAGIGPLLTESHVSMREDFEITVPEVDLAVDEALAAGALGARMTGGGFGGCVIALVRAGAANEVATRIAAAFGRHGFATPTSFAAAASRGAYRVD